MFVRLRAWFQSVPVISSSEATDGDLVRRFAEARDESAFTELVRRHGPMVLATCRRILHPDIHTADDAFQATFMVLATKAAMVSPPERVGAWLHGVAVHVAKKAKAWVHKLVPSAPSDLDRVAAVPSESSLDGGELRAKLDDVLAGLPPKYRTAIVLCDLEQRSRAEAASILGWSEGTLSGRLARARKLLADRLARRGVMLSLGVGGVLLPALVAPATVPVQLVASTIRIANLVSSNGAGAPDRAIPASVVSLAQGVPMPTGSVKLLAGIALVALALCGFGLYAFTVAAPNDNPHRPSSMASAPPVLSVPDDTPPAVPAPAPTGKDWELKQTFALKNKTEAIDFGPGVVATGDVKGVLKLWDVRTGKEKETILDGTGKVKSVDRIHFSPDGKTLYLVVNGCDGYARCSVEKENRQIELRVEPPTTKTWGVTRDGAYWIQAFEFALSLTSDKFDQKHAPKDADALFVHKGVVMAAASENGEAVFTLAGLGKPTLTRWKKGSSKPVWKVPLSETDVIGKIVLSENRVAINHTDGQILVFDIKTGKPTAKTEKISEAVLSIRFSPDGKWLVAGCWENVARVFDAETGKEVAVLKGHTDAVDLVAFSPDGKMIATGSRDGNVKVWALK